MKTLLIALLALISTSAFAHIEKGNWVGKTADKGLTCTLIALETTHAGGFDHPLTERVHVRVGNDDVLLAHPPIVNPTNMTAFFNHDILQAVIPTNTGARAIVVQMHHEPGKDGGPVAFYVIEHAWKANAREMVSCIGLQYQGVVVR